jgi:hypothetical protein
MRPAPPLGQSLANVIRYRPSTIAEVCESQLQGTAFSVNDSALWARSLRNETMTAAVFCIICPTRRHGRNRA